MAKIDPIELIKGMHGKLSGDSGFVLVTNSHNGSIITRKIWIRDEATHPMTVGEKVTHTKMQKATAAYHSLKQHPEQYRQLLEDYEAAKANGIKQDVYRYFLHRYLDEGKNSIIVKIVKSQSNEDSYIRGMIKCQRREEADKLLVMFVEKMGYKKLAETYKKIVKDIK